MISLEAPHWVEEQLSMMNFCTKTTWYPWVVCSQASKTLKASLLIDGELKSALRAAHLRGEPNHFGRLHCDPADNNK